MINTYPTSQVKNKDGSVVLSMAYSEGKAIHDYPLITLHNTKLNETSEPPTWWWDFKQSKELIDSMLGGKYSERLGNMYGVATQYGIESTVKSDTISLYREGQKCKFWK